MRFVCLSDTHTMHKNMKRLPKGDVLIHAGDLTARGREYEFKDFIFWFMNLTGYDTKIFCAGNHDFCLEQKPDWLNHYINDENLSQSDCVYLEDEEFIINSQEFSKTIKVYGSPWQPFFLNWAFNLPRNGSKLKEKWDKIPDDTDILITHGPPFGIRDYYKTNLGCELLRERINNMNLSAHIFGHIHDGYGAVYVKDTLHINASVCTEAYRPSNKPIVFDLTEADGKIITTYIDE